MAGYQALQNSRTAAGRGTVKTPTKEKVTVYSVARADGTSRDYQLDDIFT